jgi:hypothetical protein
MEKLNTTSDIKPEDATKPPEQEEKPKVRKITIKTSVRAAGQSHNRFAS